MIHFLLQRRLAGGGAPPPGVTNPPDWDGGLYEVVQYALNSTVSALSTFTLKSDGTWSGTSDTGAVGGNWINPPSAGVGAGYKVQFTVTGSFGAGTVTNGASAPVSLSADRSFSVQVSRSVSGTTRAQRTVRADIYTSADVLVATGTFTVAAEAEVGS